MKYYIKVFIDQLFQKLNLKLVKQVKMPELYDTYSVESLNEKRFYNIGAGSFSHPLWRNIDYSSNHYNSMQHAGFINYNLMDMAPLPIEADTAEIIYSSHTIEHINDDAVLNMLKEAYRVLKPGGCIRLTTPDAWLEYQAYLKRDISFWHWQIRYYSRKGYWESLFKIPLSSASIHQLFLHHFASQLTEIDVDDTQKKKYSDTEIIQIFSNKSMEEGLDFFTKQCKFNAEHPGNHINWWDYDKLHSFLKEAGFNTIYRSGYGQSLFAPLRDTTLFDNTHPAISLYVEAIK